MQLLRDSTTFQLVCSRLFAAVCCCKPMVLLLSLLLWQARALADI
jgi:hypothetical protein